MPWRRRRSGSRSERELGYEVAIGAVDAATARPEPLGGGRACEHCGEPGRVDIVDTARVVAYLTCVRCGHEWKASRFDVMPLPLPR